MSLLSRLRLQSQSRSRRLLLESLEPRLALHAGHGLEELGVGWHPADESAMAGSSHDSAPASSAAAGAEVPGLHAPAFSSMPGAAVSLYLDFNGDTTTDWQATPIETPPYDRDGDPANFGSGELADIEAIWAQVAEDFVPFNINVTTVEPASFANGVALRVDIGGDGAWLGAVYGGYAYIDSFTNSSSNTVFVFSENLWKGNIRGPKVLADVASHEAGHGFGLQHQSQYDAAGTKIAEYYTGPGDGRAPLMGTSYDVTRGLWWNGTSAISATSIQDDMAVLSRSQNGFGYRTDDVGNSAATATPLSPSGNQVSGNGVITQTSDVDYWSFTTGAGEVAFNVTLPAENNLDARARLVDAVGNVIVDWQDPSESFGVSLTASITTAGFYRLVVASHGGYGDVGQYSINGTIVSTSDFLASPSNLKANAISKSQINLTWADHASGETGYSVERSTDGVTFAEVARLGADSVSYSNIGLARNTTYTYRVRAIAADVLANSDASNAATATTLSGAPAAASNLTASFAKSKVTLLWNDNSTDETEFKVQRSTGNTNWSTVATVRVNTTTYQTSKPPQGKYYFRIVATNTFGDSSPSNVVSVDSKGTIGATAGSDVPLSLLFKLPSIANASAPERLDPARQSITAPPSNYPVETARYTSRRMLADDGDWSEKQDEAWSEPEDLMMSDMEQFFDAY